MSETFIEPVEHWPYAGFTCLITRNTMIGTLCGYVLVPRTHPWYGLQHKQLYHVDVHGGITWSAPDDDTPDLWRVGFDCAQGGLDGMPGLLADDDELRQLLIELGDPMADLPRSLDYVRHECRKLAEQASGAAR